MNNVNQKISFDEFKNEMWSDYISENIVSNQYIDQNIDFINELTFEMYDFYYRGDFSIKDLSKVLEKFFFIMFRFKAGNENITHKDKYYNL